jgi:hypothetical protein
VLAVATRSTNLLRWTLLTAGLLTLLTAVLARIGGDARWLAALGARIVELGHIPEGVPYAAASSSSWVNVPVLGELVFHGLETLHGDRGLIVAQVVAVGAALVLLALDMRAAGAADLPSALALLVAAAGAAPELVVTRVQLFSLVLFPLTLLLLRAERRAPSRRIWLLVPLIALWSNLHGAVLVGLALAACYLLADRLRKTPWTALAVLGASTVATMATPGLFRTLEYFHDVLRSEAAIRGEGLWAPLSLGRPFDAVLVAAAALLVVPALLSRPAAWEIVAMVGLAVATFHSSRTGVWLLFVAAAPAALWLTQGRTWRVSAGRWALPAAGVAFAGAILVAGTREANDGVAGRQLRDVAVLKAAGTPILADPLDAEALALDGRRILIGNPLDAFSRRDQALYLDWLDGRATGDPLLERAQVALVRLRETSQEHLARDPAFEEAARDANAALYVRR